MPRKVYYRRRRKIRKRNAKRLADYNAYAKRTTNLSRVMIGFPTNQVVKMRYSNYFDFNLSGTGYSEVTLRAASIFAPDVVPNALSHQPLGHDQWAVFYERYVVLGSRIILTAVTNNAPATAGNILIGVYLADQPITAAVNAHQLIEQGKSNYTIISNANNGQIVRKIVRMNYSAKKWHNVTNVKDADNLEADFGANPTDGAYFHVYAGTSDNVAIGGAPAKTISVQYSIDYIVLVKDPLELAQS